MKIIFKAITDLFTGIKTELPTPKENEEIPKIKYNLKELSIKLRKEKAKSV